MTEHQLILAEWNLVELSKRPTSYELVNSPIWLYVCINIQRSETGLKQAWNRPETGQQKFESTIGEAWASLSSVSLLPLPATNGWVPNGGSKQKLAATTAWNHSFDSVDETGSKDTPGPKNQTPVVSFFFLDGAFLVLHHQGEKCQNRREWTSLHWLLIFQLVKSLFEQNQGSETALNPRNSAHAPQQQPPN